MDCHSSTSKQQKTSFFGDMNMLDHINKLPDDILLIILDKLPIEEAIHMSLVAKRWKNMWRLMSRIDISFSWYQKTHKLVLPSFFEVLKNHENPKIKQFSVVQRHDPSMFFEVGLLLAYAGWKDVEEIYLDMNDREDDTKRWTKRYPFVFIPQFEIGPCHCLRKLSMKFLLLETIPPDHFMALRELIFEHVKLFDDAVGHITANCPSLEFISLTNCNPTSDLNVVVSARSNLVRLVVKEELTQVRSQTRLFIRAVHVKIVEFGLALPRKEYHIEDILDCSESTFRLDQMHHSRQALRVTSHGLLGIFSNNFLALLNKLKVGKVLTLNSWCIQALSIEVIKYKIPQYVEATHLVLETGLKRWEFPGIAYMLLACYNLRSLVIVMGDHAKLNFDHMQGYKHHGASNVTYPRVLQELTVVEFKNFSGDYQAWEDGNFDVDQFFDGYRFGSLLLWNLRTYATNLVKIVFITKKKRYETDQFHTFGNLPVHSRLRPHMFRVPHLFANRFH